MNPTTAYADAYNAAADHYDDQANSYWNRFSGRTLMHLAPVKGARLLDAGCGSGEFAIAAAEAVGENGHVVAVDLAANLLALARQKAATRRLRNVTFRHGDFLTLDSGDQFDGVIAVFSLFFAPDLIGAARHLWRQVRPGGALAITTWGPMPFEPAATLFWRSVAARRPELVASPAPWDRISHSSALRDVLGAAGVDRLEVMEECGYHELRTAEDWWHIVLGSGFRSAVESLTAAERDAVRDENLEALTASGATRITTNTVYAIARKPF